MAFGDKTSPGSGTDPTPTAISSDLYCPWLSPDNEGKENVFAGQSKIYSYMSPNKCSGMRSPLQEENSVAHHEVKCQGKPLAGIYRKREEKRNAGNLVRSAVKSEEQKLKDARRGSLAPFPNQKSEAAEPPKTPTSSCDSTNAAIAKQALKKPLKGKQPPRKKWLCGPRKPPSFLKVPRATFTASVMVEAQILSHPTAIVCQHLSVADGRVQGPSLPSLNVSLAPVARTQGKTQQNRKLTDFYPVRRSSRKSKAELQSEERKRIDELIESGKEEGMKIDLIDGKGRGVIATKQFSRGDFVVEYHGDLIEITDAKKREALYAQDPSTGCYMYYFQYLSKTYCVDATRETNRLGRLINHSKCGNCQTKLHDIDGVPHLILIASRDIAAGEELLYDYGDRSKASIEAYPWLKH
ncbi:N-lysine methyltransferase SETD8 [Fukomys damarensis]|uniref:N-lysine methyltransferase KMT5A n=1 Tax=Fukomys damarensis TaxID=885580 RepID=A0A091CXQ9_FUKDA|nr:N-lysine methyltransferase SETD8 [Fukomys damarensis]